MKQNCNKFLVFLLLVLLQVVSFSQRKSSSDVHVMGYTRSNGTYVQPHYRTAPNSTNRDNFSTSGNTNPYTGKAGWIAPDNKSLTLPESSSTPSSSSYSFPSSTFPTNDYEKLERDIDLSVERMKNKSKSDDYWLNTPSSTSSIKLSEFKEYNSFPIIKTISKSVENSIFYHNRYSWEDKKLLEKVLDQLGYNVGYVDGLIDESTIEAIKEFQRDNDLEEDGKAGNATVKKIAVKLRE
jgi:peptidoglycan hydrolase-like protein with peptidoglycan-binding domain